MSRNQVILGLLLVAIMGAGILSIPNDKQIPQFDSIIASCKNGQIGGLGTSSTSTAVDGYMFDIVVPNGECKNSVILSKSNYTLMQNNVGYFTVKNKTPINAVPTTGYCPLEKWIWDGHIPQYNMTKYEKWMKTEFCRAENYPPIVINLNDTLDINDVETHDIPEFGTIAMMILAVSIISIVAVSAKSKVIPRF